MFFHGCIQSYIKATLRFAYESGFLEYAASNDIVVVFPQTNDPEHAFCWDFGGWTANGNDTVIASKQGPQSQAIQ